jgi:hypothetical protein
MVVHYSPDYGGALQTGPDYVILQTGPAYGGALRRGPAYVPTLQTGPDYEGTRAINTTVHTALGIRSSFVVYIPTLQVSEGAVVTVGSGGGGGGGLTDCRSTPNRYLQKICGHEDVKYFTRFTLQPKSTTEIG